MLSVSIFTLGSAPPVEAGHLCYSAVSKPYRNGVTIYGTASVVCNIPVEFIYIAGAMTRTQGTTTVTVDQKTNLCFFALRCTVNLKATWKPYWSWHSWVMSGSYYEHEEVSGSRFYLPQSKSSCFYT